MATHLFVAEPARGLVSDKSDFTPITCIAASGKAHLLAPPINLTLLAEAYLAARWNWFVRPADKEEFWRHRPPPADAMDAYLTEGNNGFPPSPERLGEVIQSFIADIERGRGHTYSGGILAYSAPSGRIGIAVDSIVGEHYKRLKTAT